MTSGGDHDDNTEFRQIQSQHAYADLVDRERSQPEKREPAESINHDSEPEPPIQQLAAVRLLLLSTGRRDIVAHDILIASILEAVEKAPRSIDELLQEVRKAWPGVRVTRATLETTVNAAQGGQLLAAVQRLEGTTAWTLGRAGELDLRSSRDWADDVLNRFRTQVAEQARAYFGSDRASSNISRWTDILLDVLVLGIAQVLTDDNGDIEIIGDSLLFPSHYDLDFMDSQLQTRCREEETFNFLRLLLRASLDPSENFGLEIVHTVATGYVLYAYLGRRDAVAAQRVVGSLKGEVVFIDTPILLQLLGHMRAPVLDLLTFGMTDGVEARIHSSTFEELDRLLASHEDDALAIENALNSGADIVALRASVTEEVLATWLRARPLGGQRWLAWDLFRGRQDDLARELRAIGVREAKTDDWGLEETNLHARFRSALGRRADRGPWNLDHDARLMVLVFRARQTNPSTTTKIWPGAFVVTSDMRMGHAFNDVVGRRQFPVALTLAQWAGILGNCAQPVAVEKLASLVSTELSRRTFLTHAASVPTETAIQIAKAVRLQENDVVEAEALQLSLQELIIAQPDLISGSGEHARQLAEEAIASHRRRIDSAYVEQRTALSEEEKRRASYPATVPSVVSPEARPTAVAAVTLSPRQQRLIRGLTCAVLELIGLVLVVGFAASGTLNGRPLACASVALAMFLGSSVDFVNHLERSWWEPAGSLIVALALTFLGGYVG